MQPTTISAATNFVVTATNETERKWWKEAVIYQIYPRSFKDSNGDGIGDLRGIIDELDHLKELGVDVIWLSPFYQSPNADNGYDISDYQAIMTEFGTMEDFHKMLEEIHARGLKLIIDLVVNHSSDEHKWFQESRKSVDNPYRDYYIWRDPKSDGSAPNNWRSFFTGPAWTLDPVTNQYYLHLFATKQPDLNWENPKLRQEIYDMMHFWCQKGVDGFRMDVVPFFSKDPEFADNDGDLRRYANGPKIHDYLKEMYAEVLSKYDVMTVGEGFGVGDEQANLYVGKDRGELNMIFHFDYVSIDRQPDDFFEYNPNWQLSTFKKIIARWDKSIGKDGWNSFYWGNHDNPRAVSRFGNDTIEEYRIASAKMLAIVLMTQRATPYIYQGDEIGMTNSVFNRIEEYDDIQVKNAFRAIVKAGGDVNSFLENIKYLTRDHARTPVQWTNAQNGGFSRGGKTWIKMNPNFKNINVKTDKESKESIFRFYQQLIALRKDNLTLVYGDYEDIAIMHEQFWGYTRTMGNEQWLIVNNFSDKTVIHDLQGDLRTRSKEFILSNYGIGGKRGRGADSVMSLRLKPYESRIYKIKL
ncbi:MAG: hypothetical protein RL757_1521 [Bacteroidota bacterium]|jgi:oligo-1,6-glucosidase